MRIRLLVIAGRVRAWVREGFEEYRQRLPRECRLELVEVSSPRRAARGDVERLKREQSARLLAAAGGCRLIALDQRGRQLDSRGLASWLGDWMAAGQDVALLVGGAEGLSSECLAAAEVRWSLSPLTLPHALVRIVVAEQVYRAWSMLASHPYHRA
jgi:23S rRNA (pseudouridine1915-N3)-methyltransferase